MTYLVMEDAVEIRIISNLLRIVKVIAETFKTCVVCHQCTDGAKKTLPDTTTTIKVDDV